MMKVIFECETELGECDYDPDLTESDLIDDHGSGAVFFAHTLASLNGTMAKIEQHCYARCGTEIADRPWVRPEITLEPALGSRQEMVSLARKMHEQFVKRMRLENLNALRP